MRRLSSSSEASSNCEGSYWPDMLSCKADCFFQSDLSSVRFVPVVPVTRYKKYLVAEVLNCEDAIIQACKSISREIAFHNSVD